MLEVITPDASNLVPDSTLNVESKILEIKLKTHFMTNGIRNKIP